MERREFQRRLAFCMFTLGTMVLYPPSLARGERQVAPDAGATPDGSVDSGAPTSPPQQAKDGEQVVEVTEKLPLEHSLKADRKQRAPSDFVLPREVLTAAPHQNAAELLRAAPGVYISRPEGEAVAHQIFLRGFDAEHGQDIELSVGGVPINQAAHIHGQGYADLGFLIPELIRSVRVTEGVYDPQQGDFAVAGSIDFLLCVPDRGYRLRSSFGSFGTFRQLLLWAPPGESDETFAAFAVRTSSGFGQNRGSLSGNATGQLAFGAPGGVRGFLGAVAYGARSNLAGVLRRDDIDAARVDFFSSYEDPSANAQSALTSRTHLHLHLERSGELGAQSDADIWFMLADFRSRMNFTGYIERSRQNPDWIGRGDLIEQENHDFGLGARFGHRTSILEITRSSHAQLEFGVQFHTHWVDQAQSLLEAPQNETWDRRVDASIRSSTLGTYMDGHIHLTQAVDLRGGARADVLYFDIDDRLGNFIPRFQREQHILGFRRTALGVAFGPRASLEVKPWPWLDLVGSYGQGYRSPQPRQLEEGENAPFTKVHGAEAGFRIRLLEEALELVSAAYLTWLSSDLAFDPSIGSLERIGPTTRKGVVTRMLFRPTSWFLASISATYVHATLDAPPPATADNPAPAYRSGQLLPYVPPLVVRGDASVRRQIVRLKEHELTARVGLGTTVLSERPLPYGGFSKRIFLLDSSMAFEWKSLGVELEFYNLFDSRYAATEYSFVSDWGNSQVPSKVPARHLSAGAPRTFLMNLNVGF